MYQNVDGLMFSCTGEKIVSEGSFNAASAFAGIAGGAAPAAAAPTGGNVGNSPAVAPAPTIAPAAETAAPAPTATTNVAPAPTVEPHTDILNPPPAPVEEKFMHSSGVAYTRAQLNASGWDDAAIDALPKV